jgi:hypothetical protein
VRRAIREYVAREEPALDEAFGIWKERGEDAVEYQRRLRAEWERESACRIRSDRC